MRNYKVVVRWSEADSAFVAMAPELPGCMAHGPTEEAARREIGLAADLWIATAKEFGDPIPDPGGERLVLPPTNTGKRAGAQPSSVGDCEDAPDSFAENDPAM